MKKRKKKVLIYQIIIFIFAISIIFFTYYDDNNDNLKSVNKVKVEDTPEEEIADNKTKFEDIEYKGIDLNGNSFVVKSKYADIDLDTPELVNMTIMRAIFYFKDGTILEVTGDRGKYNNTTFDIEFRDNIVAKYDENILYANNLDFLNSSNKLNVYGNVISKSIEGNLNADNLTFDLSTNTLDISMFDDKQINVTLKKK